MENGTNQYLEAQIAAATPQKLRLLLIEGAIRFARQTLDHWEQGQPDAANQALARTRAIISELLSGVHVNESELTRRVASVYLFLFRSLTEAQLQHDPHKVVESLKVLEVERETWQLVCDKMRTSPFPIGQVGREDAPTSPTMAPVHSVSGPAATSFSLEA